MKSTSRGHFRSCCESCCALRPWAGRGAAYEGSLGYRGATGCRRDPDLQVAPSACGCVLFPKEGCLLSEQSSTLDSGCLCRVIRTRFVLCCEKGEGRGQVGATLPHTEVRRVLPRSGHVWGVLGTSMEAVSLQIILLVQVKFVAAVGTSTPLPTSWWPQHL